MPRGVRGSSNQAGTVSVKSTKQELLSAYQKLADKLAGADQISQDQADFFHSKTLADESKSVGQLQGDLENLEKKLNQSLQDLSEEILRAAKELAVIKEEISRGRQELESDHKIKVEASTLQNLLQLKLEEQASWEEKIADLQTRFAQESQQLKMKRTQEEEEYQYQLSFKRRQEEDTRREKIKIETEKFNESWQKREGELQKRSEAIKIQEDEIKIVREKLAQLETKLPIEVEKAIKETREQVTARLKSEFALEKKDYELTQKLQAQNIANLEKTIKASENEIFNLKKSLERASAQVTDLASQVITTRQPLIIKNEDQSGGGKSRGD
jgi:chromosome segregation ATPase